MAAPRSLLVLLQVLGLALAQIVSPSAAARRVPGCGVRGPGRRPCRHSPAPGPFGRCAHRGIPRRDGAQEPGSQGDWGAPCPEMLGPAEGSRGDPELALRPGSRRAQVAGDNGVHSRGSGAPAPAASQGAPAPARRRSRPPATSEGSGGRGPAGSRAQTGRAPSVVRSSPAGGPAAGKRGHLAARSLPRSGLAPQKTAILPPPTTPGRMEGRCWERGALHGSREAAPAPPTPRPPSLSYFPLGSYPHQGKGRGHLLSTHTCWPSENNTWALWG